MAPRARPSGYGDVDLNGTNQYTSPVLPESLNGFPDGDKPPAKKHNTLFRQYGGWNAHLDATAARATTLYTGNARLTAQPFAYTVGGGLTQSVVGDSAYIIDGHYVDLPVSRLAALGLSPRTFQPLKWTHFYVSGDGDIIVDEQNSGVAGSPPAGYKMLGTAKSSGLNVTTFDSADAAFSNRGAESPLWMKFPRLTLADNLDGTTLSVAGMSAVAPVVFVTNTGNAACLQVNAATGDGIYVLATDTGTGIVVSMSDKASGPGMLVASADGATGVPLVINNDSSTRTAEFNSTKTGSTNGVYMSSQRGVVLEIDAIGPLATPLIIHPTGAPAAGAGKIWIDSTDDTINFYDDTTTRKRVWATQHGMARGSAYIASTMTIAATTVIASFNMAIVAGCTYKVMAAAAFGRPAGSTRDVQISCTIGGTPTPFSGEVVQLFESGAAGQLEQKWVSFGYFTAASSGTIACVLQVTPINGSGNIHAGQRTLVVEGAYD